MLDLRKDYSLSDGNGDALFLESNGVAMTAATDINKTKLQISLRSAWNHPALEQRIGRKLPDNPNAELEGDPYVFWLSPNEWLIVSKNINRDTLHEMTRETLQNGNSSLTDLTDRFSIIELKGARIRELLMAGCGIDLHVSSFHPLQYRLTRFANLPAILCSPKSGSAFWIFVDRSAARYLWDWLADKIHGL